MAQTRRCPHCQSKDTVPTRFMAFSLKATAFCAMAFSPARSICGTRRSPRLVLVSGGADVADLRRASVIFGGSSAQGVVFVKYRLRWMMDAVWGTYRRIPAKPTVSSPTD
jgi:hypothetical protein